MMVSVLASLGTALAGAVAPPPGTTAVVVETGAGGELVNVVASIDLACPPDRAWDLLTDFSTYPEWMYGVVKAQATAAAPATVEVAFVLDAPGPNIRFRARFRMDSEARTVTGGAVGKQLSGSIWTWRLDPLPTGGTRAVRASRTRSIDDNWLIDLLGDHKQVLDLGINLSTPVLELRSLAERCDG
jgi:hypothetical protein